jgi:hypothetical protein
MGRKPLRFSLTSRLLSNEDGKTSREKTCTFKRRCTHVFHQCGGGVFRARANRGRLDLLGRPNRQRRSCTLERNDCGAQVASLWNACACHQSTQRSFDRGSHQRSWAVHPWPHHRSDASCRARDWLSRPCTGEGRGRGACLVLRAGSLRVSDHRSRSKILDPSDTSGGSFILAIVTSLGVRAPPQCRQITAAILGTIWPEWGETTMWLNLYPRADVRGAALAACAALSGAALITFGSSPATAGKRHAGLSAYSIFSASAPRPPRTVPHADRSTSVVPANAPASKPSRPSAVAVRSGAQIATHPSATLFPPVAPLD